MKLCLEIDRYGHGQCLWTIQYQPENLTADSGHTPQIMPTCSYSIHFPPKESHTIKPQAIYKKSAKNVLNGKQGTGSHYGDWLSAPYLRFQKPPQGLEPPGEHLSASLLTRISIGRTE
jgi:hypothetical protein